MKFSIRLILYLRPSCLQELPNTLDRFWLALKPYIDFVDAIEDIMLYKDPRLTFGLLVYYIWLVRSGIVIPGALLLAIGLLAKKWAEIKGYITPTSAATQLSSQVAETRADTDTDAEPDHAVEEQQPPRRANGSLFGQLSQFVAGK